MYLMLTASLGQKFLVNMSLVREVGEDYRGRGGSILYYEDEAITHVKEELGELQVMLSALSVEVVGG